MNDEILKKLEQKVSRRSFLRGSGLAAAAVFGAAALPRVASAQDQQPEKQDQPEKKDGADGDKKTDGTTDQPEDEFKVTRKDAQGRDYRTCPQCGYNMYRQDRTWTCENCGYSYDE
jgi:anaerobic selenocysteine-containing dehydrogenase